MTAPTMLNERRRRPRTGEPAITETYDDANDGRGRVYVDMCLDGAIAETLIGHDRADAEAQARSWRCWWLAERMPAWVASRREAAA